jgi:hypothetical protein
MLDRLRPLFTTVLLLGVVAYPLAGALPEAHGAGCTGRVNCKVCQNCRNCAHCGQRGGTCGVCLITPPPRTTPTTRRPATRSATRPVPPLPTRPSPPPAAPSPIPLRPETPYRTAFNFRDRSLVRQKFTRLDLRDADFSGANLRAVDLRDANLERARFTHAYLCGADFTGCNLNGADLKGAWYDLTTRWPEGFDPKAVGAKSVE